MAFDEEQNRRARARLASLYGYGTGVGHLGGSIAGPAYSAEMPIPPPPGPPEVPIPPPPGPPTILRPPSAPPGLPPEAVDSAIADRDTRRLQEAERPVDIEQLKKGLAELSPLRFSPLGKDAQGKKTETKVDTKGAEKSTDAATLDEPSTTKTASKPGGVARAGRSIEESLGVTPGQLGGTSGKSPDDVGINLGVRSVGSYYDKRTGEEIPEEKLAQYGIRSEVDPSSGQPKPVRVPRTYAEAVEAVRQAELDVLEARANRDKNEEEAAQVRANFLKNEVIPTMTRFDDETKAKEDELRASVDDIRGRYAQQSKDLEKMQLDGRSYFERNPLSAIFGAIAAALGGAASARTGGPNVGLQALENAIDRDIAKQKYDIEKKRGDLNATDNLLARNMRILNDYPAARAATKRQLLESTATRFQLIEQQSSVPTIRENANVARAETVALMRKQEADQMRLVELALRRQQGGGVDVSKMGEKIPASAYEPSADGVILNDKDREAYAKESRALDAEERYLQQAIAARRKLGAKWGMLAAKGGDVTGLFKDENYLLLKEAKSHVTQTLAKSPDTYSGVLQTGELDEFMSMAGQISDMNMMGNVDKDGDDEIGRHLGKILTKVQVKKKRLRGDYGVIPARIETVGTPGNQRVVTVVTGEQKQGRKDEKTVKMDKK